MNINDMSKRLKMSKEMSHPMVL